MENKTSLKFYTATVAK